MVGGRGGEEAAKCGRVARKLPNAEGWRGSCQMWAACTSKKAFLKRKADLKTRSLLKSLTITLDVSTARVACKDCGGVAR